MNTKIQFCMKSINFADSNHYIVKARLQNHDWTDAIKKQALTINDWQYVDPKDATDNPKVRFSDFEDY